MIRLDDLIPKQDVTGGHQLLFGVTDKTQSTNNTKGKLNNMQDKKKKTNIKLNDLKPKKDAKGGVATNVSTSPQPGSLDPESPA